ncbi:hypothetical protein GYMLUDRAFT_34142 [Collybiopsis luxurians FD-317 M1]|nr:hypothetical protein GYMLUDRAFT_34142 [Collybiopsis luxurians FD-317 M1]
MTDQSQTSSSSSFVYPIKSLLSNIQPAPDTQHSSISPPPSSPELSRSPTFDIGSKYPTHISVASSSNSPGHARNLSSSPPFTASTKKRRSKRSQSIATTSDYFNLSQNQSKRHSDVHPNFSHFPAGGDTRTERSFSRYSSSSASVSSVASSVASSHIPEVEEAPPSSPQEAYNSRHPPALSLVAQQAFTTTSDSLLPRTPSPGLQWNPSELGIVHLPSIASSSRGSSTHGSDRSLTSKAKKNSSKSSEAGSNGSSNYFTPEDISSGDDGKKPSGSKSSSDGNGEGVSSESDSLQSQDSGAPLVSVRFQYVQDEHGHHIVTGRVGQLTRCEDEPIRAPGAVQGFGVLIVVEENEDTLVVRQVSENATELLGLPPRYLFKLECFTDILPESQASALWDNIQFLSEPSETSANAEDDIERDSPDIFLLSGYGAPGTAIQGAPVPSDPYDPWGLHEGKRRWTCWCAVHRPQPSPYLSDSRRPTKQRPLIIMEFELENDHFNPLYHPPSPNPTPSSVPSGLESPESTESNSSSSGSNSSGSASSSVIQTSHSNDGSENTLISQSSTSVASALSDGSSGGGSGSSMETLRNISDSEITPPVFSDSVSPQSPTGATEVMGPLQARSGQKQLSVVHGMNGDQEWIPSTEDILESTTTRSRPLLALERLRRMARMPGGSPQSASPNSPGSGESARARRVIRRSTLGTGAGGKRFGGPSPPTGGVSLMDVFSLTAQINEQLGDAPDLETFLKVVVGVIKDITQFHRVLVYQFDEVWNGQVVAELVDWSMTHDLYKGLHFPAGDIPAQARELYKINKVRILYDRDQPTARIVVRGREDLDEPLNMTHCYLRAMSPIHVKYLGNMGVRASMSVSIMAFGSLWGLVACHSYGEQGMRVSFPVRQMLRLLSQSISRNIERLSYAQRLHTRKLINTISSENHPTGYIVSNADDLLGLFDADFGILVIGDGAKILGPNQHGQEILIMAEYLRLKQYNVIQVSQAVTKDFPDLNLSTGLEVIAGLLCVPLSSGGKDFIAFLRKGQRRDVHWAGKPHKPAEAGHNASLEPRKSFKTWSETVAGRCRAWTDEQLETAGVLALVYGKFIEVWRQKETALQTTRLTNLLLSNATHEVRTPLNHIINYLEMALNGPLDFETRDNLSRSHVASKNLLFTINDLLDLTRLESGNETSFNEPFDLAENIQDAVLIYRNEAARRNIEFEVDVGQCPSVVVGDAKKIRTVVQNLMANALKYTTQGKIAVSCKPYGEPEGLRAPSSTAMEIVVADTGCGIAPVKLESIFREIEQVESSEPKTSSEPGVGLGLAVVARIVEQLGGQLRVRSKVDEGSQFSFLLPLSLSVTNSEVSEAGSSRGSRSNSSAGSLRTKSTNEIDSIVEALASSKIASQRSSPTHSGDESQRGSARGSMFGTFPVPDSQYPVRPIKVPEFDAASSPRRQGSGSSLAPPRIIVSTKATAAEDSPITSEKQNLRVLIVEDNDINRLLLAKRLRMDGHIVVNTTNGQEGLDKVISDRNFDCILMDINMPILNGFEASEKIREVERTSPASSENERPSLSLNGRIPIFAVSASLYEQQRSKLSDAGMDGWILKPIDFKRLAVILKGVTDPVQRELDRYRPGCNWEIGGWLALSSAESSPTRASSVHDETS